MLKNILRGWAKRFKLLKITKDEAWLSKRRLKICYFCDFSKNSKILEILNGTAEYVDSLQCTKCGCPCLEKSLVINETCPINKWDHLKIESDGISIGAKV